MFKKVVSIFLTFTFLVSIMLPVFAANSSFVSTTVDTVNSSKVNFSWNNAVTLSIYRDGVLFKSCNQNANNGAYYTIETASGQHNYRAEVTNSNGTKFVSDTVSVTGTGKPVISLQYSNNGVVANEVPRLYPWFKIYNYGSQALDLKKLKVRYWFTMNDGPVPNINSDMGSSDSKLNPIISNNPLDARDIQVKEHVFLTFTKMTNVVPKADYYCDIQYSTTCTDSLYSGYILGGDAGVQPSFIKQLSAGQDAYRNYKQGDDYSFDATATSWKENKNICVYYDGQLIWGNEPFTTLGSTNLKAEVVNNNQVKLDWSLVPNAGSYKILRSTSLNGTYSDIAKTCSVTSFVDTSVTNTNPGTKVTYYYKVVPYTGGIVGPASNIAPASIECFKSTDYGLLKYNIFNYNINTFIQGAYIPIQIELVLKEDTTNPVIEVDKPLINPNNTSKPFEISVINEKSISVKAYSTDKKSTTSCAIQFTPASNTTPSSSIKLTGNFLKGQTIKLDVKVKVTATKQALANGIDKYYSTKSMKPYQINFDIKADKRGVATNPISTTAQINVNIVSPNVLR